MSAASQPVPPTPAAFPFAAFRHEIVPPRGALREAITAAARRDERDAVRWLLAQARRPPCDEAAIAALARALVERMRVRGDTGGVAALMQEFSLSSREGVALMCLAEALPRIPDRATADRLIADKLGGGDWRRHPGASPSWFVNAATRGLAIAGRLAGPPAGKHGLATGLTRLAGKGGAPLIRKGAGLAMRLLGERFVAGRSIGEALAAGRAERARGYTHSYDMLGEAALTATDAARYLAAYEAAIHALGKADGDGIHARPGISVKLSALHPRYARAQRRRVMEELLPRLASLALLAKRYDIGINVDAEEADRLDLSLDLLDALAADPRLDGFEGLGFVVQAYQKRCPFVIDHLADLARRRGSRLMVRLVKGAYWDSEIKRAQEAGLDGYPVYTRKEYTDASYLVCAQKLLDAADALYPQFATHNAQTIAAVALRARQAGVTGFEFQCLHGMGESLYDLLVGEAALRHALPGMPAPVRCRIYAPVGAHDALLPYLVRRLLENGANSSFVHRIADPLIPVRALVADPLAAAAALDGAPHPAIPLPAALFGTGRVNSAGVDVDDEHALRAIGAALAEAGNGDVRAAPMLAGAATTDGSRAWLPISNPADGRDTIGHVSAATSSDVDRALAAAAASNWPASSPSERAALLIAAADRIEAARWPLCALLVREAGKTLPNALAEVREAVDFLRYYGGRAPLQDSPPLGPSACISPWNFPLAIFVGQVAAALAAGNPALAKPAGQTPLVAARAVALLHAAGVPRDALQLLPGDGGIGALLVADARVKAVLFTGSTGVARQIHRRLARRSMREGVEIPLVAETGGQNAMIVDSSALPEQVVHDVLRSAFDSAGQRCSALRVLCLQQEIADRTLAMLDGALRELAIGNPDRLSTDVGPVIDADARRRLAQHVERMRGAGHRVMQLPLPAHCRHGDFFPPTVIEIDAVGQLPGEVFGPVLHVLRFRREALPQLIDAIHATGYGLTMGVQTRLDDTADAIAAAARVGNLYVNRNMVGAVVGVQPFGGEGLSGTGPKAGGPLILRRLQREDGTCPGLAPDCAARAVAAGDVPAAAPLQAWRGWLRVTGRERLLAFTDACLAASPTGRTIALPGPTGERNTLSFAPRGQVLCAATDPQALLRQVAAVLATGNRAVLTAARLAALPTDLPPPVASWLERFGDDTSVAAALADAGHAAALRDTLAQRDGPLVAVVECDDALPPLWRLVVERVRSVNTAAAGGDAALMTL